MRSKNFIQSRLGKLDRIDLRTLQLAALLGRIFDYEMLLAVGDLDDDALIDVIEKAEQAQLIEEVGGQRVGSSTEFSFSHALIHTTLLSSRVWIFNFACLSIRQICSVWYLM